MNCAESEPLLELLEQISAHPGGAAQVHLFFFEISAKWKKKKNSAMSQEID